MKYFLSLTAIIKNEDYLEEFIMYYMVLGVEHFFLYDNESSIPLKKRLNKPIFYEKCTIIDFPGKVRQIPAYEDCLKRTKLLTEWLIIVDGDEFILPKKHFSLRDFLTEYKDYQAIGINWVMFGSNNHEKKQPGFLIDKYTRCGGFNDHIKTITKPLYTISTHGVHSVKTINPNKFIDAGKNIISGPFNKYDNTHIIQINHYWGKSLEDYKIKMDRGHADILGKREFIENYMTLYNEKEDLSIKEKYLDHVKRFFTEHNIPLRSLDY
jgi:hypothetical protein